MLLFPIFDNNPKTKFVFMTDASNFTVGAVLLQEVGTKTNIIACALRQLSKPQQNYLMWERAALAVVKYVKQF